MSHKTLMYSFPSFLFYIFPFSFHLLCVKLLFLNWLGSDYLIQCLYHLLLLLKTTDAFKLQFLSIETSSLVQQYKTKY